MSKTWFVTGASRGLGLEIAKAALRAGDNVTATGRNQAATAAALGGETDKLQTLALDVTDAAGAETAVSASIARFGALSVLVNNAGYGQLGPFEENTLADAEAQFATNVFGVLKVTWAALPAMRAARCGHIFNISSIAGLRGGEGGSLYSASKFALEGFSESLAREVATFNIHVTLVEPGFFRTEFLSGDSARMGAHAVPDYAEISARLRAHFAARDGTQAGDPRKLADALVQIANLESPPLRFLAGTDAVGVFDAKLETMRTELNAWRELSISTDYEA
jgi:NAD(P)-dependent dehydrogenase (short-subunit alcohol dehydrogenase family)